MSRSVAQVSPSSAENACSQRAAAADTPDHTDHRVEPYGLVLKAGRWYVVAGPGPRTFRVDQILGLTASGERFVRPDDFDPAAYWTAYQRDFHERLHTAEALVRLAPGMTLARATPVREGADVDGWTVVTVPIESVERAHDEFLKLGADAEVLGPPELRAHLARTVTALAERYRPAPGDPCDDPGNPRPVGGN